MRVGLDVSICRAAHGLGWPSCGPCSGPGPIVRVIGIMGRLKKNKIETQSESGWVGSAQSFYNPTQLALGSALYWAYCCLLNFWPELKKKYNTLVLKNITVFY